MSLQATPRGIALFVLKVLGWCAALFAAWYFAAQPLNAVTAWGAARLVEAVAPVERVKITTQRTAATFELDPDEATTRRHKLRMDARVDVTANPLKFTFGLPFFLALLLATRPAGIGWKAPVGAAVVIALAMVGLACEVLIQAGSLVAPGGEPLLVMGPATREAVALGFQLGTLIFPTVVPAVLWGAMDRETLAVFAGG